MQLKTLFVFLFLLAGNLSLSAQKLFFRQLRPNIPNSPKNISKLLQDKDGFIWLGTEKGLLQFDGITYTPFYTSKPNSVTALFQDDSAKIWQGYKNGEISYLQNGRNIRFLPEEGLPKVAINAILQDEEKRIWFATYGEGVYYFHENRLYNINTDDGLADNYTYDLEVDNSGNIWVATDRGISKIHISNDKKIVQNINQESGLPDNLVTCIDIAGDRLFIGMQSQGFCEYRIHEKKFHSIQSNWQYGQVNEIKVINGSVYIGSDKKSLLQYNVFTKKQISQTDNAINKVTGILYDNEGNIWVAGNTDAVHLANENWLVQSLKDKPQIKTIRAVLKLENEFWLGTENGIFIYNNNTEKLSRPNNKALENLNVTDINLNENQIWISTLGQGVYIYHITEKWLKHFTEKHGLVNDNILSITQTGNKLYLATLGGVSVTQSENSSVKFQNLTRENSLPADYIYQVLEDSKGNIWFATDGKGLIRLQNGKYTVFTESEGLLARTVISVAEVNNTIWASTLADGVYVFDGTKFQPHKIINRERRNLRAIAFEIGKIFLVNDDGIDVFNPQTNILKKYKNELGLAGSDPELNAWYSNGNDIFFAAGNTIVQYKDHFKGEKLKTEQPQTRIKNISLFLDTIPSGKTSFSHNENHISFDYIGLWFHNPEEVTYQVKLEGYDPDWVNTRDHFITYPNLPPGNYTFKVRSSATDNFTNASVASYQFHISAPFWKRAWFYIPLILLLAAGGYFYIRQREKILKKEAAISRQNIEFQYETLRSQVNPHFLFNSFNTLAGVIETDQQMAVEYVEHLSDFFRNLLVYKDKDVISVKEELQLLENYFFIQKKRFGQNLHLDIQVEEKYKNWLLPPLCLQLLIENAIKHNIISREKPLHISIITAGDPILKVQNNFQPKAYIEKSTGIGLANIKSRYSLLTKAPVNIINSDKHFTVELPLLPPQK